MNQRQYVIQIELKRLTENLEQTEAEYRFSGELENYGVFDYDAAVKAGRKFPRQLLDEIEFLRKRIPELQQEYEQVADNEVLLEHGRDVHDLLKEKYPITHATKIVDVGKRKGWTFFYPLPVRRESAVLFRVDDTNPAPTRLPVGRAEFVEIARESGSTYFAFAPEIDTIFVATT